MSTNGNGAPLSGILPSIRASVEVDGRTCELAAFASQCEDDPRSSASAVEILEEIFARRYDVQVRELGLDSPHADHMKGRIKDPLDEAAVYFVAHSGRQLVGCLRMNPSRFSSLGDFARLYMMRDSPAHPAKTAIGTRLNVRIGHRPLDVDRALLDLAAAVATGHLGVTELYTSCRLALVARYERMGYIRCGDGFHHPETGEAVPMRLDLTAHAAAAALDHRRLRLCRTKMHA